MSRASSSASSSVSSHDCLFCCAFNAFLLQHNCYHKLLSNNTNTTGTAMLELQRRSSKSHQKTPSPTPSQKWFIQNDVTRDEIAKMLNERPVGAFLVRPSKTCGTGSFVLSVRVPVFVNGNGIAHYLIVKTASNRYKFQGDYNEKEWSDIESLIVHHTIMREFLPCTLQIPDNGCENGEDCENHCLPKQQTSSSTLASSSSSWSSGSRSRSANNDHEVLADFLQSMRTQGINSRSSSLNRSRPTVCC